MTGLELLTPPPSPLELLWQGLLGWVGGVVAWLREEDPSFSREPER